MKLIPKKKFKVCIKHYSYGKYAVYYSYYRFISVFKEIKEVFTLFSGANAEVVKQIYLGEYENAKEFASRFKTIEDVIKYNKELTEEYKRLEDWVNKERKREIPCNCEQIN